MVARIPVEVDELGAEWLAGALGLPVTRVEVLDRHSGTTGRARLAVAYDDASGPSTVFVKLAPFDPRQRRFVDAVGLGVAEARFYRDVAHRVPVRVPAVHHASCDDDGGYVMVLEDLVASHCRFPSPSDADLADVVSGLVVELGHLHGAWAGRELDDPLAWVTAGSRQAFARGGRFVEQALARFGDEMSPAFRRLADLYARETAGVAELYGTGRPTLVHGDPHLGNLFLDGSRVGFFDWGMVMWRAGVWDVAYVLCNSVPTELRRSHEREWLTIYRDVLATHGVELDADEAWAQYRLFAVYSWSSATSTAAVGDRWQAEGIGRDGMRRATRAIEDLESIPLLESLLARA